MSDLPEHLTVTASPRGFASLPEIPGAYGGHALVYESSAAEEPHLWLQVTVPADLRDPDGETVEATIHLDVAKAWQLAEQLMLGVQEHYHGDSRPEVRVYDRITPA